MSPSNDQNLTTLAERATAEVRALQDSICAALTQVDGQATFRCDEWQRSAGGGGRSMVMEEGAVFEKAGVNTSVVYGAMQPDFANTLPGDGLEFFATGVSLVLHPRSPLIPTTHANFRFLRRGSAAWFGGGADLTPMVDEQRSQDADDARLFHATMKDACDAFDPEWWPKYKAWCDEYFYLPHRKEARGVGGIFYDQHNSGDFEKDFAFTRAVGEAFLDVYPKIVRHRMDEPWTDEDRQQQLVRRGRYVEFNLLYDRGTMFGFRQGANIETMLSSMPPLVAWP